MWVRVCLHEDDDWALRLSSLCWMNCARMKKHTKECPWVCLYNYQGTGRKNEKFRIMFALCARYKVCELVAWLEVSPFNRPQNPFATITTFPTIVDILIITASAVRVNERQKKWNPHHSHISKAFWCNFPFRQANGENRYLNDSHNNHAECLHQIDNEKLSRHAIAFLFSLALSLSLSLTFFEMRRPYSFPCWCLCLCVYRYLTRAGTTFISKCVPPPKLYMEV